MALSRSIPRALPLLRTASRSMSSTQDWSATQYLKFRSQRTRPSLDLIQQIPLTDPQTVVDLGCGPGNSTEALVERFPAARVSGIDSSPNMIEAARKALPGVSFSVADMSTWALPPQEPADLIFSNAALQWLARGERIPAMKRLIASSVRPGGGVFAMQVPDSYGEMSFKAMRAVAEEGPWAEELRRRKPSLGPFETPQALYDELKPLCSSIELWHTYYQHQLGSHRDIVEWVKGTGLRPYLDPLGPQDREGFLEAYYRRIKEAYPLSSDGTVLLRYPRLFMVAVKR